MTAPVIDPATFAELQESAGADFVAELVGTFLEETPALLAELRSARHAADADRFRRAAHSIKSNSQTFGALALGALARDIELQGLHASAAADLQAIDALQASYAVAAAALKELRDV
jgi:HPt (histidine-containing phosphotransfer) domain-containing protein